MLRSHDHWYHYEYLSSCFKETATSTFISYLGVYFYDWIMRTSSFLSNLLPTQLPNAE